MKFEVFNENGLNTIRAYCLIPMLGSRNDIKKDLITITNVPDKEVENTKEWIKNKWKEVE